MEEIIYLNGEMIPRSQAKLSPFDHGFLYGYGIFETMRSYGGSIFRLDRHLARLHHAAETLSIAHKLTTFDLEKACYDVLKANNLADARLRLTVTAGEGDINPNPDNCSGITVFIVARKALTTAQKKLPARLYGNTVILSAKQSVAALRAQVHLLSGKRLSPAGSQGCRR